MLQFSFQVEAWDVHVKNWVSPDDAAGYVHSSLFHTEYLRTPDELKNNPYPWNLHTLCSPTFKKSGRTYTFVKDTKRKGEKIKCRVLHRKEASLDDGDETSPYLYTVEVQQGDETIVVDDFPRLDYGIDLYDKAYSPMWHMEQAFRHKMFIPDDIFPESWMNLPSSGDNSSP